MILRSIGLIKEKEKEREGDRQSERLKKRRRAVLAIKKVFLTA